MQPAVPEGSCIRSPNFETGRVILGLTDDLIREYLEKKIPQSVIARLLGVSRLTVRHYIHTRKLQKPTF